MSSQSEIPASERRETETRDLLQRTADIVAHFLASLGERRVRARADVETLRRRLRIPLGEEPTSSAEVIEQLAADADERHPRIGRATVLRIRHWRRRCRSRWPPTGSPRAGIRTQGSTSCGPAAAVVEEAVGDWLVDLFGLPAGTSMGLTTGCQMAHFTCLAAARNAVLRHVGWNVEDDGLFGAPPIEVVVGEPTRTPRSWLPSATSASARERVHRVATDAQGRIQLDALRPALNGIAPDAPLIVCLQAGEVNSGAFDPFGEAIEEARRRRARLPGSTSTARSGCGPAPSRRWRPSLDGAELADSWATDAHKWLNVPYDSGIALVRDPQAHAVGLSPPHAPYLQYSAARSATRCTGSRNSRGARGDSRSMPRYSRSVAGAYASLSTTRARSHADGGPGGPPSPGSMSSMTWCSTRCSSASTWRR